MEINEKIEKAILLIIEEYLKDEKEWYLGFSGGKDSTLVLLLCFIALNRINDKCHKPIQVVYCDTNVEIPIIDKHVHVTLANISLSAKKCNIPLYTNILKPEIDKRFFSKLIGRGYPPPTNIFRWCTDVMRIDPMRIFYSKKSNNRIVLLGVRKGESKERDKTVEKYLLKDKSNFLSQLDNKNTQIFSTIIDFSTKDVWLSLQKLDQVASVSVQTLMSLYGLPNNFSKLTDIEKYTNRFGCWVCTVVRKDKSVQNLIQQGYSELIPLLNFRDWLLEIRDNKNYRCEFRRNGNQGLGPFTLEARQIILDKLLQVQDISNLELITQDELLYIYNQWENDANNPKYVEKEMYLTTAST